MSMAFTDLKAQAAHLKGLDARIQKVLAHGQFIMGPEVAELEKALAEFCGAKHVVSCASGTDALWLALMAKGVGAGDAVFVPSFTFAASAEAVALLGATPVFVDVDAESYTMDVGGLEEGIRVAKGLGLRPACVMPVDLFGHAADYYAIGVVAVRHGMFVLCDAAQSFGAFYRGRRVGTLGDVTATSFFPTKPLGCYGDGGAIFTDDAGLHAVLASLRVHGKGNGKYDNVRIGTNSRLDTLQAAILLEKMTVFAAEMDARQKVAARYGQMLSGLVAVPNVAEGVVSAWAQFTVKAANPEERTRMQAALSAQGIPSMIYYPVPMHQQPAYQHFPRAGALLTSETLASHVFSLPMHPYLDEAAQARVVRALQG